MRLRDLWLLPPFLTACSRADPEDPERTWPQTDGPGYVDSDEPDPTGDTDAPSEWAMLDSGYITSCGLLTDGRIVCWGHDDYLGSAPRAPSFVQISVGNDSGCALEVDGSVTCWCVDDDDPMCAEAPSADGFVEVRAEDDWACAEDGGGRLQCWGAPSLTSDAPSEVVDWSIEFDIGCAVLPGGNVTCWGATDLFSLDGLTSPPPAVAPPSDRTYTQVAVGRNHACALDTEGEVHCWGSTMSVRPYPMAPPGPFTSIIASNQITCGFRPDRTAECWYDFPQLWDVDDDPPEADGGPRWEPPPGRRWAQIGLGVWDACGLTVDGEALCWPAVGDTAGEVLELPSLSSL